MVCSPAADPLSPLRCCLSGGGGAGKRNEVGEGGVGEQEEEQGAARPARTHALVHSHTHTGVHSDSHPRVHLCPLLARPDQGPGCHYSFLEPLRGEMIGCRAGSSRNQGGVNFQVQIKVGPFDKREESARLLGFFFVFFLFPGKGAKQKRHHVDMYRKKKSLYVFL